LERSIEEIRTAAQGRDLNAREKTQVEELELELARVKKAREALGDKAPSFGGAGNREGQRGQQQQQQQGKRRREGEGAAGAWRRREDSETDEELKGIPWPRDRSPPVPKEVLVRLQSSRGNSNLIPLGGTVDRIAKRGAREMEPEPAVKKEAVKTVYEAQPQIRDLKKEAVRFAPNAVRRKIKAVKGEGGLVEEEDVARLEKEGYVLGGGLGKTDAAAAVAPVEGSMADLEALEAEERRFQSELRNVTMEEVDDEDA
jgi:hypothetical protein